MNKQALFLSLLLFFIPSSCTKDAPTPPKKGSVIFIHPDGTGLATWNVLRVLSCGPDGDLNWDKLPHVGLYKCHVKNSLSPTSHSGATIHAYGVKVHHERFGSFEGEILARSGVPKSIMQEAMDAHLPTGIVNSGAIFEPGSAVFAASAAHRSNRAEISKKVIQSGLDLIFSGGEEWLLPQGMQGQHGEGIRQDGLDLIAWAKANGYHVMYRAEDLDSIPSDAQKLLGVFALRHTFNDKTEEDLRQENLPNFQPSAPSVAQMTLTATEFLSKKSERFFLVVEEEGTDNFGNYNNANGMLEALQRADDAIGVARKYLELHPDTLLVTTSDSEAGGMELIGFPVERMNPEENLQPTEKNGAPVDGKNGTQSVPFLSAPDQFGQSFPFSLAWSTTMDTYGSVVARSEGLNGERLTGTIDNTEIYRIMYLTLFGKCLD